MATFHSAVQNKDYFIPDDGEMFRLPNSPTTIYKRVGNIVYALTYNNAPNESAMTTILKDNLIASGFDPNTVPTKSYGTDFLTLFQREGGLGFRELRDPAALQSVLPSFIKPSSPPATPEVITKSVSPTNPNEAVIRSNQTGIIQDSQAPTPLAQKAMQSGQAITPDATKFASGGYSVDLAAKVDVPQPASFAQTDPTRIVNQDTRQTAAQLIPQQSTPPASSATASAPVTGGSSDVQALMSNPSIAVSGNYARLPNGVIIDTRTNQVVQTGGPTTQGPPPAAPSAPATPAQTTPQQPQITPEANAQLQALLSNPNLTPDQRAALQSIYNAITTNDLSYADRLKSAISAATQYSDPFFKAQTRLVSDALERGLKAEDDDLAFQEQQKRTTLTALLQDIDASKNSLSLDEQQQLRTLARQLQTDLDTTRDDLASRGFTTSSVRARKEQLVNDTYGDLRQSAARSLTEKTAALGNQANRAQSATAAEVARLQELAKAGKLDKLRTAEESVGSDTLASLGYGNLLGGVGGAIPRAQAQDALSFASGFVF